MNSYLLLRDNKEKGPYSLDQLIQIGFKPYDLVWIQGKSAAWRYPGEIEELKAYAPVVEEQPFDRFFKKKSDDKKQDPHNYPVKKEEPVIEKEKFIPQERKDPITIQPKKNIYVTMPRQKQEIHQRPETFEKPEPHREYMPKEHSEEPVKTISITENPAAAQVKYEQPLAELKEAYAKNFQQRKQKIARKSMLLQRMKKASVFLYMIALGVLIGLTVKSFSGKKPVASAEKITQTESAVKEPEQSIVPMTEEKKGELVKPETKTELNLSNEINPQTNEKKIIVEDPEPIVQKKQSISDNKKQIDTTSLIGPGVDVNPITGERNRKNRTTTQPDDGFEKTEEKTVQKNDISNQVYVKGSDYKRGAFGGIRDLQLTVINNSKYILDNVTVELVYIKANELPLKTDNIQFHSVSPNGSMTIAIPPTSRGVKVNYKIIKIESKEFNETAGL